MKEIFVFHLYIFLALPALLSGQSDKLQNELKTYISSFDRIDYQTRASKDQRDLHLERVKPYFYSWEDSCIFQDYYSYKNPFLLPLPSYFNELFTTYNAVSVEFASQVFFDEPRPFNANTFPSKYSKNVFKNNGALKADGWAKATFKKIERGLGKAGEWITGLDIIKDMYYVRTGIVRRFVATNAGGENVEFSGVIYLYWIYKNNSTPKIILSTPINDGKDFDSSLWLDAPSVYEIEQAKIDVITHVKSFFSSVDKLPGNNSLIEPTIATFLKSDDIDVELDFTTAELPIILIAKTYLQKASELNHLTHAGINWNVSKIDRNIYGFTFTVEVDLSTIFNAEDQLVTNHIPTAITVQSIWKNRKFGDFRIEKVFHTGKVKTNYKDKNNLTHSSTLSKKANPVDNKNTNTISQVDCNLGKILATEGKALAEKYFSLIKLRLNTPSDNYTDLNLDSLFNTPDSPCIEISKYYLPEPKNYSIREYLMNLDTLSSDKRSILFRIDKIGEVVYNGTYCIGTIEFTQYFASIYNRDHNRDYCDITKKSMEIILKKSKNVYILKIKSIKIIKTIKDTKCIATKPKP